MRAHRLILGLFAGLAVLIATASADTSLRKPAILVEAYSMPKCAGFDCPPWPVPDDRAFCFQSGENFFTGIYLPLGMPWETKGKRLLILEGKSVEIVVTDRSIQVEAPRISLRLKRVHSDPLFRLASCSHN